MPQNPLVQIKLKRLVQICELDIEDRELPDIIHILLNGKFYEDDIADAALDVFHTKIPISCLDDFEITVLHEGIELETNPNHRPYSLSGIGDVI